MSDMEKRRLPHFKNEAEEAQWWYDHRDEVADDMIKAMREGRTGPGVVARLREKLRAQETIRSEKNSVTSTSS
jgi:hypothetical protein